MKKFLSAGLLSACLLSACLLSAGLLSACGQPSENGPSKAYVRAMNLGKAHLENRSSKEAIEAFSSAVALDSDASPVFRDPALRNLARAYFLARQDAAAIEVLQRVRGPENQVATSDLKGLAEIHQDRFDQALPHFIAAVELDPHTSTLRFQLASAYQTAKRHDEALAQLQETVRLDPLHTGAHYKLVFYARRSGQQQEVVARQRELTQLRKLLGDENRTPEILERCVYTQAETAPAAETVPAPETGPETPSRPPVSFVDATLEMASSEADAIFLTRATAATVLDMDEAGRLTLFVASANGAGLLRPTSGGGWTRSAVTLHSVTLHSVELHSVEPGADSPLETTLQALSANFHDDVAEGVPYDPVNDALNDILLLGPDGARLLKRRGADDFEDVTIAAGLGDLSGNRGQWVDYENDGDLDLAIAGNQGLELWQNNGDGRFEPVSEAVGIRAAESTDDKIAAVDMAAVDMAAVDLVAVDLADNLAVDLIAAHGGLPTRVLENQRTGTFKTRGDPPGPWPAARRVLADNLDHDAHTDVVLLGDEAVVLIFERSTLPRRQQLELSGLDASSAVLLDFDNDGNLDLAVAGSDHDNSGRLALWRNTDDGSWPEVTQSAGLAGLDLAAVRDLLAADFDNDGDTDLILLTASGLRFLRNEGGNARRQLKIRLVGTKTNPNGLGARLEVRHERFWSSRVVHRSPVEIGLGNHQALDSVQVRWTNGIVDNRIDVPITEAPLIVAEKNVATGSCPFLYIWDGDEFRFVTDILGNSPLGLSLRRGIALDADPDEFVLLGTRKDFVPRDGAYVVQVTEEMREVLYLDEARLVAVDHAPGVEIHATDKLMPAPFPDSELVPLADLRPPRSVLSDDGIERGAALRDIDGHFAPPGEALPPPFRGMTRPLTMTLDFGPLDTSRPLVLALTGWLQYGDASTNIALSQGPSERVVPPRLEAQVADGRWRDVDVVVGMPAGKTKTILVDLAGKLPSGTRRLRLVGSFEIRWDRIALGQRLAASSARQHTIWPAAANLAWRGFSEIQSRAPGHPTTPEYAAVADNPPWRTALRGWVTRYGDVLELVGERDERLALVSAGDALELTFDASALPPVAEGKTRTFFFYSVGWDKDGDVNVIDGDAVEPLPVAASGDWRARYNTRWIPWNRFGE